MMDSYTDKVSDLYAKYATAFFPGVEVQAMRQGHEIPGQSSKKAVKTKLPDNFLHHCNVTRR